jgi:hypothetical protein
MIAAAEASQTSLMCATINGPPIETDEGNLVGSVMLSALSYGGEQISTGGRVSWDSVFTLGPHVWHQHH